MGYAHTATLGSLWTEEEDDVLSSMYLEHLASIQALQPGNLQRRQFVLSVIQTHFQHRSPSSVKRRLQVLRERGVLPRQRPKYEYTPLVLTPAECGWLAGILDGEGTVNEPKQIIRWGQRHGWNLRVVVCYNTDRGIIDKVLTLVPHARPIWYTPEQVDRQDERRRGTKDFCHVNLHGHEPIRDYLAHVIPYLAGEKRLKAVRVLDFIESRWPRV